MSGHINYNRIGRIFSALFFVLFLCGVCVCRGKAVPLQRKKSVVAIFFSFIFPRAGFLLLFALHGFLYTIFNNKVSIFKKMQKRFAWYFFLL